MQKGTILIGLFLLAVSCTTDPVKLAQKHNKLIHQYLEKALTGETEGKTAFELAYPLYKAEQMRDSLQLVANKKIKDMDAQNRYFMELSDIRNDSLVISRWKAVTEENRAQVKNLPVGTWLINDDTKSPYSIFRINKPLTVITPYNYKRDLKTLIVPTSMSSLEHSFSLFLFFNYDESSKLMEIRTLDGKSGHFRTATQAERVMGLYEHHSGNQMFINSKQDIKVWVGRFVWGGDATYISIDGKRWVVAWGKIYRDGCYDAIIDEDEGYDESSLWFRQMEKDAPEDFMFVIPESEKLMTE